MGFPPHPKEPEFPVSGASSSAISGPDQIIPTWRSKPRTGRSYLRGLWLGQRPELEHLVAATGKRGIDVRADLHPWASLAEMERGRASIHDLLHECWYLNIDLEQRDHVTALDPYLDLI